MRGILEQAPTERVDENLHRHLSDLVWRVRLRGGSENDWAYLFVLIEFHGTPPLPQGLLPRSTILTASTPPGTTVSVHRSLRPPSRRALAILPFSTSNACGNLFWLAVMGEGMGRERAGRVGI